MKPEIRIRWASALRSKEYVKGTGRLRRIRDGVVCHCALGVLCDLYAKETGVEWDFANEDKNIFSIEDEAAGLSNSIMDWAGINSSSGLYLDENEGGLLTIMGDNDGRLLSFDQIADIVETVKFD